MIVQILLIVTTMVSYVFVRKLKDNAKVESVNSTSNPWQNKLYNKPIIKKFVYTEPTADYNILGNLRKS